MRNTIRKVTIVVPVLMTSCQVSEKPNSGPVKAQAMTTASATPKAHDVPTHSVRAREKRSSARPIAGRRGARVSACNRGRRA